VDYRKVGETPRTGKQRSPKTKRQPRHSAIPTKRNAVARPSTHEEYISMVAQIAAPRPFPTRPSIDPADFESLADYRAAWDSWADEWDASMAERTALLDEAEEAWEARIWNDQLDAETIYWQEMDALTAAHNDRKEDYMYHTVGGRA
jgi:hypothetical protein